MSLPHAVGQDGVADTPTDSQVWQMLAIQLTPESNKIGIPTDVFDSWSTTQMEGILACYE
jgi:hypothetical protein